MDLIVDLSPSEEAQLSQAAKRTGLAPAELVKKLVKEHLPAAPSFDEADLGTQRVERQDENVTATMPDAATQALFAKWAEEDEKLGEHERTENERIYSEIEKYGIPRVIDARNAAAIAMLQSWLEEDATDDPEAIRQAEEEVEELKRSLNANRAATGERLVFP